MTIRLLALFAASASLSGAALAAPTSYPLTLENCGFTLNIDRAPQNVVSIGQTTSEILYALDLSDHMAGTALWFTDVLPEYQAQNAKVERINDNMPSFEAVINKRPDMAITQYEWMIGAQGVVGTRPQFHDLGVNTYILPVDCEGKDNLVGSDGTRLSAFTSELIYKSIAQFGQIFDRQDAAAQLEQELRQRETTAISQAQALNTQGLSAAVWFSSPEMEMDPYMAGQKGVPGFMLNALGLRNVVQSDEEWPTVGWETIAKANPSILVLAKMDRRRFEADDIAKKLEFLQNDPVAREMDAVKNNRIVILDAQEMEGSLRMVTGIERLTQAMAAMGE